MKLKFGDKVALIAPASGQKQDNQWLIDKAIGMLTSWGLEVVITPSIVAGSRYLAATDTTRANSLINALTHPDIKAVFTTRGGYGCARLLSFLKSADVNVPSPRMLLGFSDITTLHLHFSGKMTDNLRCVHSPNIATEQLLGDKQSSIKNQQTLYDFLFDGKCDYPSFRENLAASEGLAIVEACDEWKTQEKTGGCLSLIVTSLGTSHEIVTTNKWLFIEEVGETPYKIDRMLTHLKNAGKFDQILGVVLGGFIGCNSENINIEEVVAEFFEELPCPVIKFPYWGHGEINVPWIYS